MLPISRVLQATVVLVAATTLLMTTEVSAAPTTPSPFPSYVRQAMDVVAKATRVPVLGPVWLPNTKAIGGRLMPPGGTFAATTQATATQYQINFWVEAHALPVNSPKVVQDSDDPSVTPIVTINGHRYATRRAAAKAVTHNPGLSWMSIPHNAMQLSITPTRSGWIWKNTNGSAWYEAWDEKGWLIETIPIIAPKTGLIAADKEASQIARSLIGKIMAPMPGQRGPIAIAMGDGDHTNAQWQRGRIVYSVFANYGLSSATTVVGSLFPLLGK